jgi:hypothetical protein
VFSSGRLSRTKKRKKKKKPTPPPAVIKEISDLEMLIKSVALINGRVILKYSKGEAPHWDRVHVWKQSLLLADSLESNGNLPPRQSLYFEMGTIGFDCRIYETVSIGKIALLERFERVNEDLYEVLPLKGNPLPCCVRTEISLLDKRVARLVILNCFENEE